MRFRFTLRALLGAAVAPLIFAAVASAAVASFSGHGAAAGDCTADPALDSEEQAFLVLLNNHRAVNGLPALTASYKLSKASQWKSTDMGVNSYFAHDDLIRTWVQRIRDCGYTYNTWLGENIAAGNSGAQATFNQWKNSSGHNANMLSSSYTTVGIGRAFVSGSPYSWYWTTDFGGFSDGWPGTTPTNTAVATNTPTRTPTRTSTPVPTNTPLPDTTAPSLTITSPANGATVAGSMTLSATASDAGGMQKVRFWAGTTYLGYDASPPYAKSWTTAGLPNGRYTLKAQALDNANNATTKTMSVYVVNADSTAPAVTITAPAAGATVGGTVAFSADASDTQGLQKVRFWADGVYLGYDAVAPYTVNWDSAAAGDGPTVLQAQAVDWANNTMTTTRTVTVAN